MGSGRPWTRHVTALAALALAAPALTQPTAPDGPVPTARYERPPQGVDPSILDRPPPREPEPAPAAARASEVATPSIILPEVPAVRRRDYRAPASLETTTAAPTMRPWERPRIGGPPPAPTPAPQPEVRTAAAPAPGRTIELQVGAFADRGNAERAARTARMAGPTRISPVTVGGVTYHRVIVGPGSEGAMRAALERLGFRDARPMRPS